jgi:hypothetical protein
MNERKSPNYAHEIYHARREGKKEKNMVTSIYENRNEKEKET